jgi:ABC-2 type transport system permease protein
VSTQTATLPERRRIRGPSALGSDPRRFFELTRTLAVTDFKLKFFGSVLGYLWQLMRPLMLFGVLYVVFVQFVRLGGESIAHYPAVLLTGIVTFMFFSGATGGCVSAVLNRENLVRKIEFPLLLALGAFATGIGMLLSALYVRYRDVEPIWEVLLQVFFYATPILYPIELVAQRGGEDVQHAMMLNPLTAILQQIRHAVIDPSAASAGEAAGGWVWMLIPLGIIIFLFALGFWVFNREAPRIAEEL